MANKQYPVHYANFVCHFGTDELLDYLHEIVLPAFRPQGSVRTFKDGRYFFDGTELLNLAAPGSEPELAICGRFVKDMVVKSEQRWDRSANEMVPDRSVLETAPSSIFVLLLASHKLIFLLETSNAPGMESFRSTAANFLAAARRVYIDSVASRSRISDLTEEEAEKFLERGEDGKTTRITKVRLNELLGPVDLELVPLSNEENLRKFLERFQLLQAATLRLVKPNSEIDNDEFLKQIRTKSDDVGSKTSTLTHRNPEGLVKAKVLGQLQAAAAEANTEIKLEGKDALGQVLRGSNEQFKVVSYLDAKPTDLAMTALRMFMLFSSQRREGLVKTPESETAERNKGKLAALATKVRNTRDDHA